MSCQGNFILFSPNSQPFTWLEAGSKKLDKKYKMREMKCRTSCCPQLPKNVNILLLPTSDWQKKFKNFFPVGGGGDKKISSLKSPPPPLLPSPPSWQGFFSRLRCIASFPFFQDLKKSSFMCISLFSSVPNMSKLMRDKKQEDGEQWRSGGGLLKEKLGCAYFKECLETPFFFKRKENSLLFPLKIARGRRDEGQTQTGGGIGGT